MTSSWSRANVCSSSSAAAGHQYAVVVGGTGGPVAPVGERRAAGACRRRRRGGAPRPPPRRPPGRARPRRPAGRRGTGRRSARRGHGRRRRDRPAPPRGRPRARPGCRRGGRGPVAAGPQLGHSTRRAGEGRRGQVRQQGDLLDRPGAEAARIGGRPRPHLLPRDPGDVVDLVGVGPGGAVDLGHDHGAQLVLDGALVHGGAVHEVGDGQHQPARHETELVAEAALDGVHAGSRRAGGVRSTHSSRWPATSACRRPGG